MVGEGVGATGPPGLPKPSTPAAQPNPTPGAPPLPSARPAPGVAPVGPSAAPGIAPLPVGQTSAGPGIAPLPPARKNPPPKPAAPAPAPAGPLPLSQRPAPGRSAPGPPQKAPYQPEWSKPKGPKPPGPPPARTWAVPDTGEEGTPVLLVLALSALAFVLYAFTCSRFVLSEDVAEFQALAASHGIAHAGYPLYLLLLEGFHRLPLLTAPWRANLTSALCAAIAVGLTLAVAARVSGSRLAGVAAALALACSYSLWHDATRAEIYAFSLALSAGALLAYANYLDTRNVDPLAICGVLLGFSLTAHLSSLALAAAIAIALLVDVVRGRTPFHHTIIALCAVLVGLSPLLLIPLRDTPDNAMNYIAHTFDEHSGRSIPWSPEITARVKRAALLLSGTQYLQGGWFHPFQDALARVRVLVWNLALNDFPGIGLLLAAAGGVAAFVRRSTIDFLLLGWLAGLTALFLYAAFPMSAISFFLPGAFIVALLMARGLHVVGGRFWPVALVLALVVIAAPAVRLQLEEPPAMFARTTAAAVWRSWPEGWNPAAPDSSWETFGRGVLTALPRGAHVLSCWEEGTTLLALQRGLRLRSDVEIHLSCDSPGRIQAVIATARNENARVFTTIPPKRMPAGRKWVAVTSWKRGGLWRNEESRQPRR